MSHPVNPTDVPSIDVDWFSDEILADTFPTFKRIRDAGPVVWLPGQKIYAIGRFDDVQAALRADHVLISGQGVWFNEQVNGPNTPVGTLTRDGEEHDSWKKLLIRPLSPKALKDLKGTLEAEAASIVAELTGAGEFEAVGKLASHLPTRVVSKLVGLNGVGYETLLKWAQMSFDIVGPLDNERVMSGMPDWETLLVYAANLTREGVVPGSWADGLFAAVDRDEIPLSQARAMILDYTLPSLDTTILATAEMLYRLATEPGAFETLRKEPELISNCVYETVRISSPARGFSRIAVRDYQAGEMFVPAGARVMVLFASANHDERHYPYPEKFDIRRNSRDHLGWGNGRHLCAGMHLARLEMETLLKELVKQVGRMTSGKPERLINNGLQGYARIPLTLHAP